MKKSLISEWTVANHIYQLFMVDKDDGNPLIILQTNQAGSSHKVQFLWEEGSDFTDGITEALITRYTQQSEDLIVGIMVSPRGKVLFGWTPCSQESPCLSLMQGRWQVKIEKSASVEFLRWVRKSLQMVERMAS